MKKTPSHFLLIPIIGLLLLPFSISAEKESTANSGTEPSHKGFYLGQNIEEVLSNSEAKDYKCKVIGGSLIICQNSDDMTALEIDNDEKVTHITSKADILDLEKTYNFMMPELNQEYGLPIAHSSQYYFGLWKVGSSVVVFTAYPVEAGKLRMLEICSKIEDSRLLGDIREKVKKGSAVQCRRNGKEKACSDEDLKLLWSGK